MGKIQNTSPRYKGEDGREIKGALHPPKTAAPYVEEK
jgi:hypothetical protein